MWVLTRKTNKKRPVEWPACQHCMDWVTNDLKRLK